MRTQQTNWVIQTSVSYIRSSYHLYRRLRLGAFLQLYLAGARFVLFNALRPTFPQILLINVTSACNLACKQCFIPKGKNRRNLAPNELRAIVQQASDEGVTFIGLTGGEPFLREKEVLGLIADFPQLYFLIYTNALLIGPDAIERLRRCSNVILFVGMDGRGEETDARRGAAAYERVAEKVRLMSEAGIPVGASVMVTHENLDAVTDARWMDALQKMGCLLVIFVPYAMSGRGLDRNLLLSEEDIRVLGERERAIQRQTSLLVLSNHYDRHSCLFNTGQALYIDSTGELGICPAIPFSNSFYSGSLKRAWQNARFLHQMYRWHRSGEACLFRNNPRQLAGEYADCSDFNKEMFQRLDRVTQM